MLKHLFILFLVLAFASPSVIAESHHPRVRISAWYWLNSAPHSDWKGDFTTMKQMGFTDVLLCWGLDISAVATRKTDTKLALQYAHEAGIGVYLLIWHPHANSLPQDPKFMQISADGKQLPAFDVFNPEWRSTQWKSYLQDVASTYRNEPALTGYAFDDSFSGGVYSYGPFEQQAFGSPLPHKPSDPNWDKWVKIRQQWWEDWASDTVSYIRSADPDPNHEIYIEDTVGSITNTKRADDKGLDFARVAMHFDAVGGYTTPVWSDSPDSAAKVSKLTTNAIQSVRKIIGPGKKMIYTFWSADISEERKPGPAAHPTAAEIQSVCEDALKLGVFQLDMYGYRIGEYKATREEMARMVPPEPAPYILTGQFPQKFIWDRPEIHDALAAYLHTLNSKK
ncbi:MAG TPA: hypothetical protein VFE58_04375 [Tepidisphaeraceae bacterium]|jgi:hypothetical protein|nr:hypothetical protein [Tepidisphaeraceae bacterium]